MEDNSNRVSLRDYEISSCAAIDCGNGDIIFSWYGDDPALKTFLCGNIRF